MAAGVRLSSETVRLLTHILGHDKDNQVGKAAVRRLLTGNLTFYIRSTGSDTNDGLTPTTPFLTGQKAVDALFGIDRNSCSVFLDFGAGAWNDGAGGPLIIATTLGEGYSNVHVVGAGSGLSSIALWTGFTANIIVEAISLDNALGGGTGLIIGEHSECIIGDDVAFIGDGNDIFAYDYGAVTINTASYLIAGNKSAHFKGSGFTRYATLKDVTIVMSGTPVFADAVWALTDNMLLQAGNVLTSSGACTGYQYSLTGSKAAVRGNTSALPGSGQNYIPDGRDTIPTTAPVSVSGTTKTVLVTESAIISTGSATLTLTLLSAAGFAGRTLMVKTSVAFTVVSASANVVPIAGGAAATAILPATPGAWAILQSDGANWITMSRGT